MHLDTDKTFGEIEPSAKGIRDAMVEVAGCSTSRDAELDWARKLRFLTPAIAYTDLRDGVSADPSVEDDGPLCSCEHRAYRKFNGRDRRLDLLDRDALPDCLHYLAVSYCWSSSAQALYEGEPFKVRMGDSLRDLKCPPALLERLLGLCYANGLSFIWIDQECIDQEDSLDMQLGIQAMDCVYQWAEQSVAVLEVCLTEQRHVDALEIMMDAHDYEVEENKLSDIIEALELITADPWFTRAWCLQEATSGSDNMALLLRHADNLNIPELFTMRGSKGNIRLDLADMNNHISCWFPLQLDYRDVDFKLRSRIDRFIAWWFEINVPNIYDGDDPNLRVICNGTQALWHLSRRGNSVVSDRLAIMANLCDYSIRLQAARIEQGGHDFSISALTLALLNGDISVLVGHYDARCGNKDKRAVLHSDPPLNRGHGFTWCPPATASLGDCAFLDNDDDDLRIDVVSLSARGLQVKGCIWVADLQLNLSSIKETLSDKFGDNLLGDALEPDINDMLSAEQATHIRGVRVMALVELICHLFLSGYEPLARQIWSYLRRTAMESELNSSESIRSYDEAPVESIIDVERRTFKWRSPYPGREDGFQALRSGVALALIIATIRDGALVLARPVNSEARPSQYRGVFDTAQIGDCFFSPRNKFGCETPRRQYGWYPMNWRLQHPQDASKGLGDTVSCQGLVAGNWTLEEEHMSEIYLI